MTQEHPITPPPELAARIIDESETCIEMIRRAYAAGADQELEACCANIHTVYGKSQADWLRNLRRPKPPSLKEQALHELNDVYNKDKIDDCTYNTIRRALEALDD